jgi:hypothetical protein
LWEISEFDVEDRIFNHKVTKTQSSIFGKHISLSLGVLEAKGNCGLQISDWGLIKTKRDGLAYM